MADGTPKSRRGSIFGALLLITIGGLFLYANMDPGFPVWALLARYWPVLIIFWGLSKLVDYFRLRGTPEAASAARLRGGEIFGLIVLILCGTAFSQVWDGDRGPIRLFHYKYEFPTELTEEIELPATLSISGRGDITVSPSEGNQVRVVGRKTVYARNREAAAGLAELFEPVLEKVKGGYKLRWRQEGGSDRTPEFDIELFVPATLNLVLESSRGDISASDLRGNLKIDLTRGSLTVSGLEGNLTASVHRRTRLDIENIHGNVTVEGRGRGIRVRSVSGETLIKGAFFGRIEMAGIEGRARFESRRTKFDAPRISGEVRIDEREVIVRGIPGPGEFTLKTRDKEIELDDVTGPIRIENRNGPVEIRFERPPTKTIVVTNRRGRIELLLPANSRFKIEAENVNGDIESDFTGLILDEEGRRTKILGGQFGSGGPTIVLKTSHAGIRLRRVE